MLRILFTVIAVLEVIAPERLMEPFERLALENGKDIEWDTWVMPVARAEGALVLWLLWRSDRSYSLLKRIIGVIGLVVFAFPRAYMDIGTRVASAKGSTPRWRSWVFPFARVIGFLYILVGLREFRRASKEP